MWNSLLRIGAMSAMVAVGAMSVAQAADDNLLQTIKDRGVLRVCDVDYAPWNIKNPATNQWRGSTSILSVLPPTS